MDDVKRGVLLQLFGGSSKLQDKAPKSSLARIRLSLLSLQTAADTFSLPLSEVI